MIRAAYEDQSADQLRLTLCTGLMDLKQFLILQQGQIQTPFGTLKVGIIGASHFWHFDFGGENSLYEVFACTPVKAAQKRVSMGPLKEVAGNLDLTFFGNLSYHFNLEKRPLQPALAEILKIETKPPATGSGLLLSHTFPAQENSETLPPKTLILVQGISARSCQIKTFHGYPNNQQVVITKTTLTKVI
jgi:hypothetical protein